MISTYPVSIGPGGGYSGGHSRSNSDGAPFSAPRAGAGKEGWFGINGDQGGGWGGGREGGRVVSRETEDMYGWGRQGGGGGPAGGSSTNQQEAFALEGAHQVRGFGVWGLRVWGLGVGVSISGGLGVGILVI